MEEDLDLNQQSSQELCLWGDIKRKAKVIIYELLSD